MAPNAFELPIAQRFLLHKCVAQQILFHDYQLLCAHEAVWDKGAEELLAPSQGVRLLGRDRVRQCVTEPKHFNVQCATEEGGVRHGCAVQRSTGEPGLCQPRPSLGIALLLLHFVMHFAVLLVVHFAVLLDVHFIGLLVVHFIGLLVVDFDKVQVPLLESLALGLACPWHHQPQQRAL